MTRVDFAGLIFIDLVGRVTNKTHTIPYGRINALIIEVILGGDFSLATGQTVECKAINSNIFNNPKVTAQGLTPAMQIYLDFCRTRDREQQALLESASPSTRSESNTQSANHERQGTQSPKSLNSSPKSTSSSSKEGEELVTSLATLATPSSTISKSNSKRHIVEDLVPRNVYKKKCTKKSGSASGVDNATIIRLKVPQGVLEAEQHSEADPITQADQPKSPHPSVLSQKSVDKTKGTTAPTQPSQKGEGIETKTSSQGHTVSPPISPSSTSQKVGDIIKGTTEDPAQIQLESESMHILSEDVQPKSGSIECQGDTAAISQAGRTLLFLHSKSAQAANVTSKSQDEIQASFTLPKDTLVKQHTLVEGQSDSPLNISLARSESTPVSGQVGPVSYMDIFRDTMLAPCVAKELTTCPHDSGEKIVTSVDSDSSFDDELAHPSSRDVLMEETSEGVDQNKDQLIPTSLQSELKAKYTQTTQLIIPSAKSAHETHSHEKMSLKFLYLHPSKMSLKFLYPKVD
uniref:cell wall protein DAN4-like n=1 Tax=Erigeron canadensis TaxID=72917 RepID=UPI001CB8CE79|nr:cell wall protein DAN4-like [Erigeron canadensis]